MPLWAMETGNDRGQRWLWTDRLCYSRAHLWDKILEEFAYYLREHKGTREQKMRVLRREYRLKPVKVKVVRLAKKEVPK